tara:strand:+ start:357 stop:749 length:393 start_codon:yes stop_codon:yes gene_type:complete
VRRGRRRADSPRVHPAGPELPPEACASPQPAGADIQKKYKRLALIYHPDKAGASSENVDRFQAVTTAYSVLNHDESRAAYWDMYRIRCYLHQGPPTKGQSLAPFYIFPVKKHDKTVHRARPPRGPSASDA